jgi:hypothetical protein
MNRKLIIAAVPLAALLATGCTHAESAQQREQAAQQSDTSSLISNQPIPHYNWSQIRQTAIDAQDIAANGTPTTSFFFNMGSRDPLMSCPSLGVPVPNTAQLSNPEQIAPITSRWGGGATNLPQMDPYGIYAPAASEGTYVICLSAAGKPYLNYWEGPVQTVTVPAVWDYTTHRLKVTGAPTFSVKTKANK